MCQVIAESSQALLGCTEWAERLKKKKRKIKYALALIDAQCFQMLHMMKVSVIR